MVYFYVYNSLTLQMMAGPGMGGPFGKILVNPNFPVGAGLTLLPTPGPGGYGAPPMGLRGITFFCNVTS